MSAVATAAVADENKDEYIVSVTLMKATGLYQLLDPCRRWPRSDVHPYRAVAAAEVAYGVVSVCALAFSTYAYAYDANELASHLMLTVALFFSTFKVAWLYRNVAAVRDGLDATSVRFLRYNRHRPGPLLAARARAQRASSLFAGLWFTVTVAWCLTPFVVRDAYTEFRTWDGHVRRLRYNSLNYAYPSFVTERVYNEHFLAFYVVEMLVVVCWGHVTLAYDTFIVSMCIAVSYQLRTIADSYSRLTRPEPGEDESKTMMDLKLLIQDQQRMFRKMKKLYAFVQPVTFVQLAAQSMLIILQTYMIFINHYNGLSLTSVPNVKLFLTVIPNIVHLLVTCHLYGDINDQKESINFALYSSDWTDMSIGYRKMLLFTERMNNAEKLKLKISLKKIVNLEMFASVMHTTYSIISVLAKNYGNTKKTP